MMKKMMMTGVASAVFALATGTAMAAAPADWSKIEATDVDLLYPGVSPVEWIMRGPSHGGARVLKRGETCMGCHSEEIGDMGQLIASGGRLSQPRFPARLLYQRQGTSCSRW